MTKTISSDLQDHLDEDVTTLARCWRITRQDDVEFFFTDHDTNLTVDGDVYLAMEGFSSTATTSNASLDVDNLNVVGIFDNVTIKEDEIAAGLFDYAEVRLFVVNWADLTQGTVKMRRGWFGEAIKSPSGIFKVELRGMTQPLAQTIGELYGAECRADLGDLRCKLPINPDLIQRSTAYAVGDYGRVATTAGSGSQVYENAIYKVTTAGITASVAPTFDPVAGHSTQDGGGAGGTVGNYTAPLSNFSNGNFIRIDDSQYTFVTTLVASSAGAVLIGASVGASMDNLTAAISGGAGSGTVYNASTPVNTTVSPSLNGPKTILTVTLINLAVPGQFVLLSESSSGAWDVANLSTTSNAVVWQAQTSWTRSFVVASVTSRVSFGITVSDARAVTGWFNGGALVFETGDNDGKAFEIKTWASGGGAVTLYLPVGFDIQVGDVGRIYPGCDKRLATCRDTFDNLINMRAEPYLPGRDAAFSYPDAH